MIPYSNLPRPGITHLIRRQNDPSSDHTFNPVAFSIILCLIMLIVISLLLVVGLLLQSRRLDKRLEAVIAANQLGKHRPRAQTARTGFIPPTHQPAASFPSVGSCPHSISESCDHGGGSLDSDLTAPTESYNRLGLFGSDYPKKIPHFSDPYPTGVDPYDRIPIEELGGLLPPIPESILQPSKPFQEIPYSIPNS